MATLRAPITNEKKGYGRGLILGLTMAESMLLLVFCLLLIAGAIFAKQEKQLTQLAASETVDKSQIEKMTEQVAKLEKARQELELDLTEARTQVTALSAKEADTQAPSENWRELVIRVQALETSGMTMTEIVGWVPSLEALKDSKVKDAAPEKRVVMIKSALEALEKLANSPSGHDWPPIINLSEAEGNYFEVGRATLSPSFESKLAGEITDRLAKLLDQYNVDLIEVVGHTDEQPLAGDATNLDQHVHSVLSGGQPVEVLKPGDNAGLGFARAIAVARVLAAQPKLKLATILPYSAAQLIMPGDRISPGLSGSVESRRRIEIRVRRRAKEN